MNFGKMILELRKGRDVTQEELAAHLGVTAAAVSKWENNYTLPDILMLCALADYFEVTTDFLLGREKQWKYAVIAAETQELGRQIEAIARRYGIAAKGIYTAFPEADAAAQEVADVEYLLVGFTSGFYGSESGLTTLVSVTAEHQDILAGLELAIQKYLG